VRLLKNLGYTILTAAVAGALYLTHRESYTAGFKSGDYAGTQAVIKYVLERIDFYLAPCKTRDDKTYQLPRFKHVERTIVRDVKKEEFQSLELVIDCDNGEVNIPLKRVTPNLYSPFDY